MPEKQKPNLKRLKEDYSKLQKKYGLPDFEKLNEDFRIEKVAETETDFLIREIRNTIGETIENFLRFIEAVLNPVNVPMFLFPIIKSLTSEEKEKLSGIYKKIAKLELEAMKLIEYSEKREADFVREAHKAWQEIKKDFVRIIESVESKEKTRAERSNGYLG